MKATCNSNSAAPVGASAIFRNELFGSADHPFTRLFALLPQATKDYQAKRDGAIYAGYTCDTTVLEAIKQHTSNAADRLLLCMQPAAKGLCLIGLQRELSEVELAHALELMQLLSNLLEACHFLNAEVAYELGERRAERGAK